MASGEVPEPVGSAPPGHVHGRLFWGAVVVGWAGIGYGVWGVILQSRATHPREFAGWFIGAALVHDFLLAPLVFSTGIAIRRAVPAALRGPLQAALLVTGTVALFSIPLVFDIGGIRNDTLRPRNYGAGLLIMLGAIWTFTAVVLVRACRHRARPASMSEAE